MASRMFKQIQTLGHGIVVIAGSFAPNGTGAVAATSNKGMGWTVARTSTGLFTITFADEYVDMHSATATLQLATGSDKYIQIGTYTAASKTLEIRVWDESDAAVVDVAADANNRVNFIVFFKNSGVTN